MRKVRYIAQMELAECGAACLAMLLDFHGGPVPLAILREQCGVSRDGVNARALIEAAQLHGLEAGASKCGIAALDGLPKPAILHWEFRHFVVLERTLRDGAIVVDPASGRRRVSLAELDAAFTGVVITCAPGKEFRRRRAASPSLARYGAVFGALRPTLSRMLVAALLLNLLGVLMPAGTQVMVDQVLKPQRSEWLAPVIGVLAGVLLTRLALRLLRDRARLVIQAALDLSLFTQFVDRVARLPVTFFDQRSAGDIMERVDANRELRDLTSQLANALLDGWMVLTFTAVMFAYDARLSSIVLALTAVRLLTIVVVRRRFDQAVTAELAHRAREQTTVVEAFSARETVRAFRMERSLVERYTARLTDRLNAQFERSRVGSRAAVVASLLESSSFAAVVYVGGLSVLDERLSFGALSGFLTLQSFLRAPLDALLEASQALRQARGIIARLDDVIDTPVLADGEQRVSMITGHIALQEVAFRYGRRSAWAVKDLSLEVRPGEKVALVGRSGQGKSTIVRVLLGLLAPQQGRVLIDGLELSTLQRESFLRHVGVVLQEPFLLEGSVSENIAYHRPGIGDDDVRWAARVACIDDVIERLPQGYGTILSGSGSRLSGGQRQRLALARALATRPKILVLDEATSALDMDTEARVEANLRALGCTRIVIAHRLHTVRDADRIMLIDEGCVLQSGSFEELASRAGPFSALLHAEVGL